LGYIHERGFVGFIAGELNTGNAANTGRLENKSDISIVLDPMVLRIQGERPSRTPDVAMFDFVYSETFGTTQL
jgi:hypothetical protein